MKKYLGPKSCLYPEPVLMIGTYDDEGKANLMNAAWGGISDTNEIHLCLGSHKTTDNILRNKVFTVSIGTKEMVKGCDYVGLVSGKKKEDKVTKGGFTPVRSEHINAPIFEELPFGLECELISYEKGSGHLYAKILNVFADEKILVGDKVDLNKFHPLVFDSINNTYMTLGEVVGDAFKIGKDLFD